MEALVKALIREIPFEGQLLVSKPDLYLSGYKEIIYNVANNAAKHP